MPPPKQLHEMASRYVINVCTGTSLALQYQDEHVQVLAVSILPYKKVIAHIPTQQEQHVLEEANEFFAI